MRFISLEKKSCPPLILFIEGFSLPSEENQLTKLEKKSLLFILESILLINEVKNDDEVKAIT